MRAALLCGAVLCAFAGAALPDAQGGQDARGGPRAGFDGLDQDGLRAVLIETGTNIRAHERHAVEVDGCEMTTLWHRLRGAQWVMWSSFRFEMGAARIGDGSAVPVTLAMEGHDTFEDMAVFLFEMLPGTEARHEVPFARRAPSGPVTPSERGDGTTHHYGSAVSFYIRHENHGIADRARRFAAAYVEYVERYCNVIG